MAKLLTHLGYKTSLCGRGGENSPLTTNFDEIQCAYCQGLPWTENMMHTLLGMPKREVTLLTSYCQFRLTQAAQQEELRQALVHQSEALLEERFGPKQYEWYWYQCKDGEDAYTVSVHYDGTFQLRSEYPQVRSRFKDFGDFDSRLSVFLDKVRAKKRQIAEREVERREWRLSGGSGGSATPKLQRSARRTSSSTSTPMQSEVVTPAQHR